MTRRVYFFHNSLYCSGIEEEAFCISHQVFDGKCLQKFGTEFAVHTYAQPSKNLLKNLNHS